MSGFLLPTLTTKRDVDSIIRDTLDTVLLLRFGRAADFLCLHLDDIVPSLLPLFLFFSLFLNLSLTCCGLLHPQLSKSAWKVSKFANIALVDADAEEVQVYLNYFDITLLPSTVFFFNAHHMKMDSGTPDHTKWVGSFYTKQDLIDVLEAIFRGAMKGKLIVRCPLPPERIPKYRLLFKDV
ncbi:hypothetical protein ZIOFF_075581 [Zingiber officinale]|uniref:Thioredoxin-like protein 4B n=1 Tax=Zingiber officinale TaxID=94328 RepID=A0A8J5C4B7_ZINOF|nr:hypothetical protein ZIOFF_075581 [Zingiber officinale]